MRPRTLCGRKVGHLCAYTCVRHWLVGFSASFDPGSIKIVNCTASAIYLRVRISDRTIFKDQKRSVSLPLPSQVRIQVHILK